MQRLLSLVAFVPMWTGCATAVPDELAGESTDDDGIADGKSDGATTSDSYTYFQIVADQRKCPSPWCGGWFVQRLNRTQTECYDGAYGPSCYAPWLDWSEARLSDANRAALLDGCERGATADGTVAIVRGRFREMGEGAFTITEAWLVDGEGVSDGVFVRVRDNGVRCFTSPCPHLTESRLNSVRTADIDELDPMTDELSKAVNSPRGALIAGHRYDVYDNGHAGKGRTVTASYRQLPPGRTCGNELGGLDQDSK